MFKIFSQIEDALRNTFLISERCNVNLILIHIICPNMWFGWIYNKKDYLYSIVIDGMKKRYKNSTKEIIERIESEFSVIESMGFVDYFFNCVGLCQLCKEK